jgi:hypothetical protein
MLQDSDFDPSSTCSEQRPHTNEAVQMEPRMTFRKDILPTSGFEYQNTETSSLRFCIAFHSTLYVTNILLLYVSNI